MPIRDFQYGFKSKPYGFIIKGGNMQYVGYILILGLVFFTAILIYFGLSPQQAINKLLGRISMFRDQTKFGWLLKIPAMHFNKAVLPSNSVVHSPYRLRLDTYDGTGQCVHPDVVYIQQGFGVERWKYWMVITPYPFGRDQYENPSVFASHDGVKWEIPFGLQNPIVCTPPGSESHNSDPSLLYYKNELWLYFRQTIKSTSLEANKILMSKSLDGVVWLEPIEIISSKTDTLISPSILHNQDIFIMWSINALSWPYSITWRTSIDGINWSSATAAIVEGIDKERSVWHFDVCLGQDCLHALLVTCTGNSGRDARLHYGYSLDMGKRWIFKSFMLMQIHDFENRLQYRGCLVQAEGYPNIFEVWYSGLSSNGVWTTAYLPMILVNNDLLPLGSLKWKNNDIEEPSI
ncbi:hypothetical protein [Syntrophomonas wolfei]|uniref:hypothetical protein n=1 Tax=Syntrophomonas wolfei TaxID=863 RepID=UPI0023F4CBAA|nr:hypothetical protein [Syntrophomonas wolfei]